MPKNKRVNYSSFDRTKSSPYPCNMKISDETNSNNSWEEFWCPICMEHPHNAVLLVCSSWEKGCRPFMCDTSYRHSNCLDQFRKASSSLSSPEEQKNEFFCPLCRGLITEWVVIEEARNFMNSKTRNCSLETCDFNGNYAELRKHARLEHPTHRPSVASPTRESNWVAIERERDLEDALAHQFVDYEWGDWPMWGEIPTPDFLTDMDTSFLSDSSLFDIPNVIYDFENDDGTEDMFGSGSISFPFFFNVSSPEPSSDSDNTRSRTRLNRGASLSNSRLGNRGESGSSGLRAGSTHRTRRESSNRTFPRLRSSGRRNDANASSRERSGNHMENAHASSRSRSSDRRGDGGPIRVLRLRSDGSGVLPSVRRPANRD